MSVKVHNVYVFNGRNIVDVHLDIFFNDYSIVHLYMYIHCDNLFIRKNSRSCECSY